MDVLLSSLKEYYKDKSKLNKLIDVHVNNKVSLRIIDWFVTNYSKKYNVCYTLYKDKEGNTIFNRENNEVVKHFNIFHSYK